MKIRIILSTLLVALCIPIYAQKKQEPKISISGMTGYTMQSRARLGPSYSAVIRDAPQYGGILEYEIRDLIKIGISYSYMDTRVRVYDFWGRQLNINNERTAFNYVLLHGMKYFGPTHTEAFVRPYAGVGIGMAFINTPSNGTFGRLAWDVRLGVKANASAPISILTQVQFQSIVQGIAGGMYFGTGGSGTAISMQSSLIKVTFSIGAAINF